MKKFVVMVAVALMTAMNVNAQCENLKNELSLSYGIGSTSHIGDGLGEGLGSIFSDTEFDDGTIFGPVSLEFSRHLNNPRLAIGGFISYSKWDSDILKKRGNHEKVGERKRNYLTVMPSVKWYLVNKNSFGLYTKGAVGATFYNSTQARELLATSGEKAQIVVLNAAGKLIAYLCRHESMGDPVFLEICI